MKIFTRAFALLITICAGPVAAQGFEQPTVVSGTATQPIAVTVDVGEARCFEFTTAVPRIYTFVASHSADTCDPASVELALYAASAADPTMYSAWETKHEPGQCLTLTRRLTAGANKICASGLAGGATSFFIQRTQRASPRPPANETFATAAVLRTNQGIAARETLDGARHDYSPIPSGPCAAATGAKGADRVWAIDVPAGRELSVELVRSEGEPLLYVVENPDRWWMSCAAAATTGPLSVSVMSASAHQYFIVVDSRRERPAVFDLVWRIR